MRTRLFLTLTATACLTTGCQTCDRPRLLDRLFHRDDDCPSSRAARAPALCDPVIPVRSAPVVYQPTGFSSTPLPTNSTIAPPTNELPVPLRIPPTTTTPGL